MRLALVVLASFLVGSPGFAKTLDAKIECEPAGTDLVFDCVFTLTEARSHQPVSGAEFSVVADMPSMPMAHNMRPVKAVADKKPGVYRARISLEMYGSWRVRMMIAKPVRQQIRKLIEFEKSG